MDAHLSRSKYVELAPFALVVGRTLGEIGPLEVDPWKVRLIQVKNLYTCFTGPLCAVFGV